MQQLLLIISSIIRQKKNYIALFLILVFAFALRLNGIFWGLPSELHPNFSYHPDEWIVILWASQLYSGTILNTQFEYGGTLYLSFVYICIYLAGLLSDILPGFNSLAKGILFIRFVLVIVSMLTVYLMYVVGKKLYGLQSGLLAALLLAVTPAHVIWAQRVRVDELAALVALLIFYFSINIYQQRTVSLRYWLITGACVGAGVALRAPLLLFAPTPLIAFQLSTVNVTEISTKTKLKVVSLYALSIILAYICFSPHSLLYFDTFISGLNLQRKYQSTLFVESVGFGPIWWQYVRFIIPQALGWSFYLVMLAALIWLVRFRERRSLLILFSVLPYFFLTVIASWVVVRYALPLVPFLVLLCVAFIYYLQTRIQSKKIIYVGVGVVVALTLSFLLPFQSLHSAKNVREEIYTWMSNEIPTGSTMLTLRAYGADVYNEPMMPKTLNHGFVRYPSGMQCLDCYQRWQYNYIILSDPLLGNLERLESNYPDAGMVRFYSWLQQTHELIKVFDRNPIWFGLNIHAMYSAHDMNYISPAFKVYRKK